MAVVFEPTKGLTDKPRQLTEEHLLLLQVSRET